MYTGRDSPRVAIYSSRQPIDHLEACMDPESQGIPRRSARLRHHKGIEASECSALRLL